MTPERGDLARTDAGARENGQRGSAQRSIMRMREITGGIPIPPGGSANFVPGGMHIMLVGLKQQLTAGGSVPMTLNFNGAPSVTVQVPVQAGGGGHANMPDQQGVAIGCGLGRHFGADQTTGAGAVVDDDLLPQFLGQLRSQGARKRIRSATGRKRNNQSDGTGGPWC